MKIILKNLMKVLQYTLNWGTTNLEIEGLKCVFWPGLRIEMHFFGGLRIELISMGLK